MTLKEVKELLGAEILSGDEFLDKEVKTAFACDLMSDVLAFVDDKTLLLTGLVNSHTIRTAEMMDIAAVVFVRGKKPDEHTIQLAKENGIVIMSTQNIMYVSSGILYSKGLKGANIVHK
ncbi:DRTGG domain-containing protein [Natronincola ferrireducens]|uniref:DRTGG domain-containing protein n=1 Tax=Natronincola ferrireducens TaxID=393762 RepID=A0A1G9D4Y1_9FIRM|nr:DRTGG domain-containing protein [Natronincola ferrireducens]SDK58982.1 DRTGG domain-containing protein [Natronincola ferrireducens]